MCSNRYIIGICILLSCISSSYAQLISAPTSTQYLVGIGDSITAGTNGPSFFKYTNVFSGGQYLIPPNGNLGIGGQSTAQMITSQLSQAVALHPQVTTVMGGTNDCATNVSASTIEANLTTIYNALLAAKSKVIAVTILPDNRYSNGNNPSQEAVRVAVNSWIVNTAPGIFGSNFFVADIGITNFSTSINTVDGTHPNYSGVIVIDSVVSPILNMLNETRQILYINNSDWNNQLPNNLLSGTSGSCTGCSGQVATGWTVAPNTGLTIVASKSIDSQGYNHQIIDVSGSSSGNGGVFFFQDSTYVGGVGSIYDNWFSVSMSNLSGNITGISPPETSSTGTQLSTSINGVFRAYPTTRVSTGISGTVRDQFVMFVGAGAITAHIDISRPTVRANYN